MRVVIQGQDYTAALDTAHPLTVERKLNEPSICQLWLSLPAGGNLSTPVRMQSLAIEGDDGTTYFTGYILTSPLPEYAGVGLTGPLYRLAIQAVSDEVLLDQVLMPEGNIAGSQTVGALLRSLVQQSGSTALATQGLSLAVAVNNFAAEAGSNWSARAARAAGMSRTTYRALNGSLTLSGVPGAVHRLNESDGSLTLENLSFTSNVKRAMANDVTVCGEHEPAAYVTEYFLGDGATTQFNLAANPWFPTTAEEAILREFFNGPQINSSVWCVTGGTGYLGLGGSGLAINGGSGVDGQTLLSWIDPVEMGGTVLVEAEGVTIANGSAGILAGLFVQPETADSCIAGFQVTAQRGSGAVTIQPLIQGSAAGSTFSINATNQYTLRLRIHCPEGERSRSMYYSCGDNGLIAAGGQSVLAPGRIQMEIQQFVSGVGATPVTLYDGSVANLPGFCFAVPASSVNLTGSMRAFNLRNLGSSWVFSTPASGGGYSRRLGSAMEAAECQVERTGKVIFYTGFIPAAGEQVAVSYRTIGRAVGRAVNTDNQQTLAAAGFPAVSTWIGTVTSPPARSSADCRNAAQVMQQAAASTSALLSGTYQGARTSFAVDVWPGDALELNAPSANLNAQVVVRSVKVSYRASSPDHFQYEITFANDWADDLAIRTTEKVPSDAWLPAPITPTLLANLNAMTVTTVSGSTVNINTGIVPPTGGGFEVRLRDDAFMAGSDPTLVTRSSAQSITFSRTSFADRFYVRMYDGVTPPNYSEFSAAVFVNLPLSD